MSKKQVAARCIVFSIFLFCLVGFSYSAESLTGLQGNTATLTPSRTTLTDLLFDGNFVEIRRLLDSGKLKGKPEIYLARAIITDDGNEAFDLFESVVKHRDSSPEAKTIAWFHLLGYYRLVADTQMVKKSLENLNRNPLYSTKLFHGGKVPRLDEIMPVVKRDFYSENHTIYAHVPKSSNGPYSVQIGAFKSRQRAETLAEKTRQTDDSVRVVPRRNGKSTLFLVWTGKFPSKNDASRYGNARFGKEGQDFKVVYDNN